MGQIRKSCLAICLLGAITVTVAGAGCSRRAGGPQATAARPFVGVAQVSFMETPPSESGPRTALALSGDTGATARIDPGKTLTVGLQPFLFSVQLVPAPPPEWFARNVKIDGAKVQVPSPDSGRLFLNVPLAEKEGPVTVTLSSVVPPDGQGTVVKFTLERRTEPRGTLQVLDGPSWRAVKPGESLTQRPLDLRVVFSSDVSADSLQAEISKHPGSFTWENGKTLLWHMEDPPAVIGLDLGRGRGTNGLLIVGSLASAYAGEAPRLVAFDPAKGGMAPAATILPTALPADIRTALLSPDGKKLLVTAFLRSTSRAALNPPTAGWVIDILDGTRHEVSADYAYLEWADDLTLVALTYEKEVKTAVIDLNGRLLHSWKLPGSDGQLIAVSPDGKRLAVLAGDRLRENTADNLVPYDLYVVDLGSGKETLAARDFVWLWASRTEEIGRNRPAWSPDGRKIAAVGDLKQGEGIYVRVAGLAAPGTAAGSTAVVTDGASFRDGNRSYRYPFSWSADGRHWVVGDRLVSTAAPFEVKGRLSGPGKPLWSPTGAFLVRGETDDYGMVNLCQVSSGQTSKLNVDLPVGWDRSGKFYAVRWPSYRFRVLWESGAVRPQDISPNP